MTLYKISFFEADQAYLKPIEPFPSEFPSANECPPLASPQNAETRMSYAVSKSGDGLKEQTQLSLQIRSVCAVNKQLDQDNIIHSSKSRDEEITSREKNVYHGSFLYEIWSMEEDSTPAQSQANLKILIRDHGPDVIALNETFLKPEHRLTITNYTLPRTDRQDGYGGIAFAIKKDIPLL
ncbi:hypothetical protein HHI36_004907 [Cryptolaemus montrouzieri]|uniref:Endonuclease/exonuclease/phosphatase domain-containing protein n=1 Tax=Cryptolaemus montrouzieri TaxID=559131 RepID=A0ABD2NSL2_9CUCU